MCKNKEKLLVHLKLIVTDSFGFILLRKYMPLWSELAFTAAAATAVCLNRIMLELVKIFERSNVRFFRLEICIL